jgi:predicted 3-demethylubiquinone-9 3-methyltransferase (glyoxalase superfamily)
MMSATFQLAGQEFFALNGGPSFKFAQGVSLFVSCETQGEIDELWEKLSSGGGAKGQCGWLTDKYGVSWQIVPSVLGTLLGDKDAERSKRVMTAMLKMTKLDISRLKQAYEQPYSARDRLEELGNGYFAPGSHGSERRPDAPAGW